MNKRSAEAARQALEERIDSFEVPNPYADIARWKQGLMFIFSPSERLISSERAFQWEAFDAVLDQPIYPEETQHNLNEAVEAI